VSVDDQLQEMTVLLHAMNENLVKISYTGHIPRDWKLVILFCMHMKDVFFEGIT
jgi:hypothetical protein